MDISVIIPTYNRKNILKKCIMALCDQSNLPSDYEIILVDDGSTDGTREVVQSFQKDSHYLLRYFFQKNKGPAAARNLGIKNATGKILLFIGDDIIAAPTLVREHLNSHIRYPDGNIAVLGYVTWSPEIKITHFMKWLEESGVQFGFPSIENPNDVPFNYFYTSNLSIQKQFLMNYGLFDEDFPYAAWEDIELAYRLKRKGLRIVYNKNAIGYHAHQVKRENIIQRSKLAGKAMSIFHQKYPEVRRIISPPERSNLKLLATLPLWYCPQFISKVIPPKCLYLCYQAVINRYIAKEYYSKNNG